MVRFRKVTDPGVICEVHPDPAQTLRFPWKSQDRHPDGRKMCIRDRHYPIDRLCKYLNVTRSAYYRWGKYPKSNNELRNERLSTEIQRIHHQHPDMGYRRIRDELDGHKGIHVNDKRVLRICRKYDIKSNIKWKPKSCTRGDRNPDHIAKNYLHLSLIHI